ncbi:cupin domain-containing protein [Hymenobacter busanensis]|uniref:Cupin domain-containing protein n=1 Tax=Hymenobacter busanensis TaxID=2607656 RepID=A0A7L4ZUS7_9BACT|nr:cupin domain-containing protein [Hymenobacter busanensis]KAA9332478.1 cupin domain-containing protein [Hymenobacter busanensis]QHJ07184.1 cupin domain-containing protein [Hymenobacter busanensis]
MQRRRFIQTTLAGLPLAALPRVATAAAAPGPGFKASAGEGRRHGHIQLKGVNQNILDVKVSGHDTNGALAIFEQTSLSQGRGTPLHVHLAQDEVFYVLDGEYAFLVGTDKHRLRTGDAIFLPRQVPHAWTQISPRGRMTVTLQPAGKLEEFFVAMAALVTEPTPEEVARIFAAHEMKVVGPPLAID